MKRFKKESVTVALAGCQTRIGTTTQAFQIIKYLNLMGYRACYIEMNSQGYLEQMKALYNGIRESKKTKGMVYNGVEMFSQAHIPEVGKLDYDFLVKDYGAVTATDFEKLSFLEQNYRILCGGIKPNEIKAVNLVLSDKVYAANGYLFSFVPNSDREAVKEMMEERGKDTFFADYVPDAFQYSATANVIYRTLLKL